MDVHIRRNKLIEVKNGYFRLSYIHRVEGFGFTVYIKELSTEKDDDYILLMFETVHVICQFQL
jgi:hypothetical protein